MNSHRRLLWIVFIVTPGFNLLVAELCANNTHFKCHSGEKCIEFALKCDGAFDCKDQSDETNCDVMKQFNCGPNQFKCLDEKCIDMKLFCDGHEDCSAGEDERNCIQIKNKTCGAGQYKCSDGKCIASNWVCDGDVDCLNDEENCLKPNETCGSHQFTCHDGLKCILHSQRCNSIVDCPDGSDETECHERLSHCQDNQFSCSNGTCIDADSLCDGFEDCSSGEDEIEHNCALNSDYKTCRPGEFKCSNNRCVPQNWVCDGNADCSNDEENCVSIESSIVTSKDIVSCDANGFLCLNKLKCIHSDQRCNFIVDCDDGSDEKDCQEYFKQSNCEHNQFQCFDGKCIAVSRLCNGFKDCSAGEDEAEINCPKSVRNCPLGQFLCSNNQCIPDSWLCDGAQDCSNDEENCDCADGDHGCAMKRKNVCAALRCPSNANCQILANGPTCICPKGFKYDERKRICEDINECQSFGICSQGCINTVGSYKCTCAPKFRLTSNNQTCRAMGKTGALLLYAASTSINWFALKSNHMKRVAKNLNQAIGISYDGEFMYWTNILVESESLMRAKIDGSEVMTLFTAGLSKPTDIAVDYVTRNVYFSDSDYQHLAVCSNDARYCKAIITEGVHRPRGIALYPQKGKIFWTDWGTNPMISVASMDGTSRQILISTDIIWPNGLALDWPNERVYWVDAKSKSIESCRTDGTDRRTIIKNALNHPYGIAVFHDTLYWSDWDSKSIQSCDKFTGQNVRTIVTNETIYDVEIYHPAMQTAMRNPCLDAGCSHLCLLNMNNSYTCDCPKGMELSHNKHKCKSMGKQKTILMGIGNKLSVLERQTFGRNVKDNGMALEFQVDKIAINPITGDIFVADNQQKSIFHVNLSNNTTREIIKDNIGQISAMAFDELANNLYWADVERSTVEVYSFHTHHRAVVQQFVGVETPITLTAIPEL